MNTELDYNDELALQVSDMVKHNFDISCFMRNKMNWQGNKHPKLTGINALHLHKTIGNDGTTKKHY